MVDNKAWLNPEQRLLESTARYFLKLHNIEPMFLMKIWKFTTQCMQDRCPDIVPMFDFNFFALVCNLKTASFV